MMNAVLFIGLQASGKSTFYRQRFFDSHIRLNLDMLRTRYRESVLFQACLTAKQPFVIDNTNPTRDDRQRYIPRCRQAGFRIDGYYFECDLDECKRRNARRDESARIPVVGLMATQRKMQLPSLDEGFDRLFRVRPDGEGGFVVDDWTT